MEARVKDKRKVVRLLGTLAVAAALGLAFGSAMRKYRANAAPAQAESHLASPAAAGLARGDSRGSLTGATERRADLAAELSKNLSLSTGVTRWLYWIEAIESAELADLPRLAQLANGDARATKLLGDCWIERDPRHLFDTIIAAPAARLNIPGEDLMRQLLDQWPGKDPQAVVAAVNEAGDAAILKDWRFIQRLHLAPPAQRAKSRITSNLRKPRAQLLRLPQIPQPLPRRQKSLLRHILTRRKIRKQPERHPAN